MDFRSKAILSAVFSLSTDLNGYSPGPKNLTLSPVITSNSVFAVPAPQAGTVKLPEEYSSISFRKVGMASFDSSILLNRDGSTKDSS